MQAILYCCCRIDVHSEMIEVCILPLEEVREMFPNSPTGLRQFIEWPDKYDFYNVATENIGVYCPVGGSFICFDLIKACNV